jgi:hypothetical protein
MNQPKGNPGGCGDYNSIYGSTTMQVLSFLPAHIYIRGVNQGKLK